MRLLLVPRWFRNQNETSTEALLQISFIYYSFKLIEALNVLKLDFWTLKYLKLRLTQHMHLDGNICIFQTSECCATWNFKRQRLTALAL